ncbi:hypothetical protein [Atlantibacter subterraneus]|uniref:hypothetical protein n=1 Tax=Atlantibacter subterraneus TaxID=255519 RepID=UPI002FDEA594
MNARIFMDYCSSIDIPDLLVKASLSDDDTGTALRLHLLCERMVEAWICACCDNAELFGGDKNKVLIECNAKIAIAGNLGIPSEIVKSLKTFNSLRNDLAHNPAIQEIQDSRIQSLKDTLQGYFKQHPIEPSLEKSKVGIFDAEGKLTEEVTLESDSSKNRLKLVLLFSKLMQELLRCVAASHKGRWGNQFSQFEYSVTINKK